MLERGTRIRVTDYENLYDPVVGKFGYIEDNHPIELNGKATYVYGTLLDDGNYIELFASELEVVDAEED